MIRYYLHKYLNIMQIIYILYTSILLSMRCIYNGLVAGGMALQGNSWSCSCENVWLGRWLRRWMREALQLHTSVVERGQVITSGVPCIYFFIQ